MSENSATPSPKAEDKGVTLSADALARRSLLLKGLGRGSAVLAATVPLQTLAGQSLLTFDGKHQCSVSGMHSGVHSATPSNTPTCGGYSPGWWGQSKTVDGKIVPRRAWPIDYRIKCDTVFTRCTLLNANGTKPSLFQIMSDSRFASSDEFHWVCAYLNALSHSFNFPYTGQEVIDFYNSPSYADALAFFKTYMETHT
ncbi:MAG: hypothetical protein Q7T69_16290 [Rhodoferax sp.]|nr:hypothetical protein [Rhodoferax sp.]